MSSALWLLLLVGAPTIEPPDVVSDAVAPPKYALGLSLMASPTPAEGVPWARGPAVEGRWLAPAPWFASLVLGLNRSWSANDSWAFSRTSAQLLALFGVSTTRGVGRLSAAVGLGAEAVFEHKMRQDRSRLVGIEQGKAGWRWSTGPYATLELGAGVSFWGPLTFEVAAGPSLSVHRVAGVRRSVTGLHSRLGLAYVF